LVNPNRLSSFWKNVRDTLNTTRRQLLNTKKEATSYQNEIAGLNKQITGAKTSLASSNARLDEISFLGIGFTKSNYNIFVWGLIASLAVALTVVILRSAKNVHEAKYRSTLYEEINQEYQNYKVKANEKEKKLARELQDERNKLDEIRSNSR
jgi:peptidoglycan hydrolase CwlO-like protein